MRTMYDAVNPNNLPDGGDLYAGYINGLYANVAAVRARFPSKPIVTITVNAGGVADVLDVERFDATPDQAPGWALRMRAIGRNPTVYCTAGLWGTVSLAFYRAKVAVPNWWIALYNDDPTIPPGAVAKQHGGNQAGGYDISSVADYWPGIDPEVAPMHDPAIPLRPFVADCACPTGGAWVLGDDGSVYAFGGAPFAGAPTGQPYWQGRLPALIAPSTVPGKLYTVTARSGETYTYPA